MKNLLSLTPVKILLLLLLIFQFAKINYQILGADAGAILPASRDVIKYGAIPYINLFTIYTPLSYYLFGVLYLLSDVPGMQQVMCYNIAFILLSGFIFRKITPRSASRDSIILLYLLSLSPLIGDVKIETMGLPLSGLLAFQSLKILTGNTSVQSTSALYISSIIIAILFMFKQYYGVLFPMTCVLFLIASGKQTQPVSGIFKSLLLSVTLFVGSIGIILLFVIRFKITDLEPDLFIRQLTGKFIFPDCASYSDTSSAATAFYSYLRYILLLYPYLLALPVLAIFGRSYTDKFLWFLFLLIPSVLFSFNINPHYMYIFAPYLFILFILIGFKQDSVFAYFSLNPARITILLIVCSVFASFYILRNHLYADLLYITHYNQAKSQYQDSEAGLAAIKATIGLHKKVYLGDGMNKMFTYRLDLESINSKEIGYIFLYHSCLDSAFTRYASTDSKLLRADDIMSHHMHD